MEASTVGGLNMKLDSCTPKSCSNQQVALITVILQRLDIKAKSQLESLWRADLFIC